MPACFLAYVKQIELKIINSGKTEALHNFLWISKKHTIERFVKESLQSEIIQVAKAKSCSIEHSIK